MYPLGLQRPFHRSATPLSPSPSQLRPAANQPPAAMTVPESVHSSARSRGLDEALLHRRLRSKLFGLDLPAPKVDRFEIRDRLGAGGMGAVYLAFDPRLGREVAIKLLHRGQGADRFEREARALARLSHPNVVTVHEFGQLPPTAGTEDGTQGWWMALERVEGHDLRTWLEQSRTPSEVLDVFHQAACGLLAAHRSGLVHRDFKPENVVVGADGRVRIVDFGLVSLVGEVEDAEQVDEDASGRAAPETPRPTPVLGQLTATDQWLGTPGYMAPEQFAGRPAEPSSDQFSFCVALYEALFKQSPFEGDTIKTRFESVVAGRARPVPTNPRISVALRAAIRRGLRVRPRDRNADMEVLVRALAPSVGKSRRWRWVSLGLATLGLAGFVGKAGCGPHEPSQAPESSTVATGVLADTDVQPWHGEPEGERALPSIPKPADGCETIVVRKDVDRATVEKKAKQIERLMTSVGHDDPSYPDFLVRRGIYEAEAGDTRTACRTFGEVITDFRSSEFAGKAQCLEHRLCRASVPCPEGTEGDPVTGCAVAGEPCPNSSSSAGCEAGEMVCCAKEAILLEFEWLNSEGKAAQARADIKAAFDRTLTKLCEAGDAASCWTLAKYDDSGDAASTQRACALGYRLACEEAP